MIDWLKPTRHRREVMNDVASTPPQIYHRPHVTLTFDLLMSPWPLTSSCHLDLTCSCHLDLWPPHVTLTSDLLMSPWPLTSSCHLDLWPPHVTLTSSCHLDLWPPHVTLTSGLLVSSWPLTSSCYLDLWPPDPNVNCVMSLCHGPLVPIGITIGLFRFKLLSSQISWHTNKGANGRTNRQTGWQHVCVRPVEV